MNKKIKPEDIDVVVLCGGEGKRLKLLLNGHPKPLAEIAGQPFLDILINYVAGFGFQRFIFCIGYMGNLIKQYYQNKATSLTFVFSEEKELLGTAGAIKNAETFINSSPFLVLNGDSFCPLKLDKFVNFHLSKNALLSLGLVEACENSDSGIVRLNEFQQVIGFNEKVNPGPGEFINAGIYLLTQAIFPMIPANKDFSLEYDLFPKLKDNFFGYATEARLIDIGTPERYKEAKLILRDFYGQKTRPFIG